MCRDRDGFRCRRGDLYYFTLPTPDLVKAQTFYGAVLGWTFDDRETATSATSQRLPAAHGAASGTTDLYFVVDDIHAAVTRVREIGGTRFFLSVPADKYRR